MTYLPIESHGVIGDLHTVALVGTDGTINWLCLPYFDSPSVFAAILDASKGGHFRVAAVSDQARRRQMYFPDTNVLTTRFVTPDGIGEVVDFMATRTGGAQSDADRKLIRLVRGVRGSVPLFMECKPAFDYARRVPTVTRLDSGFRFEAGASSIELFASMPLSAGEHSVRAEFVLEAGHEIAFVLQSSGSARYPDAEAILKVSLEAFHETIRFWQAWIARSRYQGRWREMVKRSCLTLKLLTFAPTGAIVAAPTTSLPEHLDGDRNWDYRYTWVRDAAFTLHALIRVGFQDEAESFVAFIEARCRELEKGRGLNVMYGIDGRRDVPEQVLDHLEGYRGSRPVRIGNDAARQLQLDISGELIDAVYLCNKHCRPISHDVWSAVRRLADWTCDHWRENDHGIWEVRGDALPFTFSKLMCWVALDRAHRIAAKRGLPGARGRWLENRDEIYEAIMTRGFSASKRSFVRALDGNDLDASLLLMPMVKFVSPSDPRMLSTLDAISRELASDGLVHRYHPSLSPDGIGGLEGTFSMCTFWLAEALARAGRVNEARLTFEKMLGYANHLGLYGEEIGVSGETLGNFPQALTHLALVSAADQIGRALDHEPLTRRDDPHPPKS